MESISPTKEVTSATRSSGSVLQRRRFLRASIDVTTREPRHVVVLRVLGELGDRSVLPIAEAWSALEEHESLRWAALETIGFRSPRSASCGARSRQATPANIETPGDSFGQQVHDE